MVSMCARSLLIMALSVVTVVTLSGCTASDEDVASTSAPTHVSASPSISPPPTASSSPTPDAPLITTEGIGAYRLGGSFTEAKDLLGVPGPEEGEADRCPWFASVSAPNTWITYLIADTVDGVTASDVIASVAIQGDGTAEGSPRTHAGVGLGSSEDEVLAAYPDAAPDQVLHADSALRVTDGDNSMVFEFRSGLVYIITVLSASEPVPAEYCG